MARPREFNKAEVIALAAELFRLKGYRATSMRDLITHVGLSSSSIYAAFGGKDGLFMAALEYGAAQDRAMVVGALDHPAGVMAGIAALYNDLIDSLLADEGTAASLTLRAAWENLDSARQGPDASGGAAGTAAGSAADSAAGEEGGTQGGNEHEVLDALRTHLTTITSVVSERLEQAEAQGELRLNQGAADLALFILLTAFNLTVVVKLTRDRDQLAAYIQAALDAVAGPGTSTSGASRTDAQTERKP